jgi:hypothetical protein
VFSAQQPQRTDCWEDASCLLGTATQQSAAAVGPSLCQRRPNSDPVRKLAASEPLVEANTTHSGAGATRPMASPPERDPHTPHDRRRTDHDAPAANLDDSPRVAGAVPIAVWRLDDRDEDQPTTQPGAGLRSRLAQRLVRTYTRRGETVIDLDDDPHLCLAATAAGRSYLGLSEQARVADLDRVSGPVSLVTVRWPRNAPATPSPPAEHVVSLFVAFQLMTSPRACVIARICPADPAFTDHAHALRTAADDAGFAHIQQIVAVSAPGQSDQFLYYATRSEAIQVAHEAAATPGGRLLHVDLMVFRRRGESR